MNSKKHPIIQAVEAALDNLDNETPTMDRQRPYKGQPHTDAGKRGETMVEGLTFRDIRDCYVRAFIKAHPSYGDEPECMNNRPYYDEANKGEGGALCAGDVFKMKGDTDPLAVSQIMSCEIEKMMGIFPNVEKLTALSDILERKPDPKR